MNPSTTYRTIRRGSPTTRQTMPRPAALIPHPALGIIPILIAVLTCAFSVSFYDQAGNLLAAVRPQPSVLSAPALAQSVEAAPPPASAAALPSQGQAAVTASYRLSPVFTREVQYWGENIIAWAEEWGLDPNLVATVMQIESCGDPRALSRAGAMGLFQVMPYHFEAGENSYDPATNARRGLGYLSDSLATHITPRLALAGYNGGINGVKRPEYQWANETVRYAYWGSGIYAEASAGDKESATLNEWLNAGGASLCVQASQRLGLTP